MIQVTKYSDKEHKISILDWLCVKSSDATGVTLDTQHSTATALLAVSKPLSLTQAKMQNIAAQHCNILSGGFFFGF